MKELYVSPEVEITCFAPVEGIADIGLNEPNIMLAGENSGTSPDVPIVNDGNEGTNGELD